MTVLKEGAAVAQLGELMGWTTVLFLIVMMAWFAWAWAPSRRQAMEDAANLPLED